MRAKPLWSRPVAKRPTSTLRSYAGHTAQAELCIAADENDVRHALLRAKSAGRLVAFRAGGLSFDTQALSHDLSVSLERLTQIHVDKATATVTVGAGARWKDILARTSQEGLLPYVLVTTGEATAGGTLSSHSISRFSPTLGREGRHVSRIRLLLPDGTVRCCSRTENPELFSAAIGGFGYFGAILEITYRLFRAPVSGSHIGVETVFEKLTSVAELVERLVPDAPGACEAVGASDDPWSDARALTGVLYLRGGRRSLLSTSRYVDRRHDRGAPSVFHRPRSPGHLALQFMAQVGPLRDVGYRATFGRGFREPRRHLDELTGYTFFQDGNLIFRKLGWRAGLAMGIRQQTYMLPCDPSDRASCKAMLELFLDEAETIVRRQGLLPALIDVLYVPADDEFLLSSSRGLPSLAITFTFERLASAKLAAEEQVCRELCSLCAEVGGRVHLVKHVFADPGLVPRMYREVAEEAALLRRRVGAHGVLTNEFLDRTLGLNDIEPRLEQQGDRRMLRSA